MIDKIQLYLTQNKLPGNDAHLVMSPNGRINPLVEKRASARESAVLVLLHQDENVTHCTLIQRPTYEGTHSGQVSFPGGKREPNESLEETALRETFEEIGVLIESIEMLGSLTEIYIPPSNFLVSPFVGKIGEKPIYTPDSFEVAEVFEFPLELLLEDKIVLKKRIKMANGLHILAPYFEINNKVVWGATAAILSELKEILKRL